MRDIDEWLSNNAEVSCRTSDLDKYSFQTKLKTQDLSKLPICDKHFEEISIKGPKYNHLWFEEPEILIKISRKFVLQLESSALSFNSVSKKYDCFALRKHVCDLLLAGLRLNRIEENTSKIVFRDRALKFVHEICLSLRSFTSLPDFILLKSTFKGANTAAFHLYHFHLEFKYLKLLLKFHCDDNFENSIKEYLDEFMKCAIKKFSQLDINQDIFKRSPFLCACMTEYILLLQTLLEQLKERGNCKTFWEYFNDIFVQVFDFNNPTESLALQSIWVLHHVAILNGYDLSGEFVGPANYRVVANVEGLHLCLKAAVNAKLSEQSWRSICKLVENLTVNWWVSSINCDHLKLLWDHFYKDLNSTFALGADDALELPKSLLDLQVRSGNILSNVEIVTSYDYFLLLLKSHMSSHPEDWPKFCGRIYSKLSPHKVVTLKVWGLYNVVLLFATLARTIQPGAELIKKLSEILSSLPASWAENSVVWCSHMFVLDLYMRNNQPLGPHICKISTLVQQTSLKRNSYHLLKIYVEGIAEIIDYSELLDRDEHTLIGSWIEEYLLRCSSPDAAQFLDVLHSILSKLNALRVSDKNWLETVRNRMIPALKKVASSASAPLQIGELASLIATWDQERLYHVINDFTSDNIDQNVTGKFLQSLLMSCPFEMLLEAETVIVQAWLRCLIFNCDQHANLMELTTAVKEFPGLRLLDGIFFSYSEDPLPCLFRYLQVKSKECNGLEEIAVLRKWLDVSFEPVERWLKDVYKNPPKASQTERIYESMGSMVFHCSNLIYSKNKPTCVLHKIVSSLLLHPSILVNKKPSSIILDALQKTWHKFFIGIASLDHRSDMFIERTLKELIYRYLPLFKKQNSPFVACLAGNFNPGIVRYMLEKITTTCLKSGLKTVDSATHEALAVISSMVQASRQDAKKMEAMSVTLAPLVEQVMFQDESSRERLLALSILKEFAEFSPSKEVLATVLISVVEKQMGFNAAACFKLLKTLMPYLKPDLASLKGEIVRIVSRVEQMRGVGYDQVLRKGLASIEELVRNCS